ncbi:MAG: response regulator [Thermodesulfobacteriota bacterium]|nr:response regulator [Thermodesulfobacteriota bacterium]
MALNILIVDDSAVMRKMIIKTMGMCGIPIGEIKQAGNGREGLEELTKSWIDIVILDINMPVMNGEEMMDAMQQRAETSDIPVVVISTEGSSTRIDRLKEKGARFIQKPFTPEIIRDTISEVTGVGEGDE